MRGRVLAILLVLFGALGAGRMALAQQVDVGAVNQGGLIKVTASADMDVDPRTVWDVISDYDHLAEFIPFVRSSRVLQRDGDKLLIEQVGEVSFLVFKQRVHVRLEVVESPPRRIVAHAVSGNLKTMEGRYTVDNLATGAVRLSYAGGLAPEFALPPLIGTWVVRMVVAKQFNALVAEILRRDAVARSAPQR